jgi:hypothetical protein
MFNPYFSHRIYCHARFRELVNLASGYLISNCYYVGDDDGCEYFKASDFTFDDGYKASVIAAPVEIILKEGHGVLFSVVNLRRQCANGIVRYEELPIAIRQRFSTCPNYIEINTWFGYYNAQKDEGKKQKC